MRTRIAQAGPRPLNNVGVPLLLGGILALSVEAGLMAVLMAMAGICALGTIIWWLIGKGKPQGLEKNNPDVSAATLYRVNEFRGGTH